MQDIVALARARQLVIVPRCSYARAWFARHPEAGDVLD
jgi:predicted GNAT family acetyltransferase